MSRTLFKLGVAGLVAVGLAALPLQLKAQSTAKAPSGEKKEVGKAEKKAMAGPFHGKLAARDEAAKTLTVGKRTFQITSETKIMKDGKPATLSEGVVGEEVSGYQKPAENGTLQATRVTFGTKAVAKAPEKSAEKKDKK